MALLFSVPKIIFKVHRPLNILLPKNHNPSINLNNNQVNNHNNNKNLKSNLLQDFYPKNPHLQT